MARTLKLFRIEHRCAFVKPQLTEALGLPRHVTQVDVLIAAATKVAARELVAATAYVTPSTSVVLAATGNDAAAFIAAGQVTEPAVYVHHHSGHRSPTDGRVLLRVALDGSTSLAGHFENPRQDGRVQYGVVEFVPAAQPAPAEEGA